MFAEQPVYRIVIVGGGSAGWLLAGLLASEHGADGSAGVSVTLVESPDVKTIGVGEGTWPTMRTTLQKIGIGERDFLVQCQASYKQGTRFVGWRNGGEGDSYYHPFSLPVGYPALNVAPYWGSAGARSFTDAVCPQGYLCDRNLAPKQAATPDYAFVANYGYHLDAGKFAALLQSHCVDKLGVRHLLDHVTGINGAGDEDIASVATAGHGDIEGDLFIDCTGLASLLLGKHYAIPFVSRQDILFNDSALAIQVPYPSADSPIASQTNSTAQDAGWIWDIGLTHRRGIGYTYSSAHTDDDAAERVLREYLASSGLPGSEDIAARKIAFKPGHRARFWHRNCVAVGMSSGFIEPLEASALVMVELAGKAISESLPVNRAVMDIVSERYNEQFLYRWDRIIDFLKVHYVLSQRTDTYWQDHRRAASIPDSLAQQLKLWRYRTPSHQDFTRAEEIFSAASYQYVLHGMGFEMQPAAGLAYRSRAKEASDLLGQNQAKAQKIVPNMPSNRELLSQISAGWPNTV